MEKDHQNKSERQNEKIWEKKGHSKRTDARVKCAVMDHNENTQRKQATVRKAQKGTADKGEVRFKCPFSKQTKKGLECNTNSGRENLQVCRRYHNPARSI